MTENEITDFRHREESVKGGVKTNARITNSRWKELLAATGESEAERVAVWKGKSCCDHPRATQSQTSRKEYQRRQTSLKF